MEKLICQVLMDLILVVTAVAGWKYLKADFLEMMKN